MLHFVFPGPGPDSLEWLSNAPHFEREVIQVRRLLREHGNINAVIILSVVPLGPELLLLNLFLFLYATHSVSGATAVLAAYFDNIFPLGFD